MDSAIALYAPIEMLDFTVGTYNMLKANDIHTVMELACLTEDELYALPQRHVGAKNIDEIKVKLKQHGRSLAVPAPFKPSVAPQVP